MKRAANFFIVLVTAPDLPAARRLTRLLLTQRLAACVNLVPGVQSHYWWDGKLDQAREILMLIKTRGKHLPALEKLILTEHPYDTPEVLALPIGAGTRRYLSWLTASTR